MNLRLGPERDFVRGYRPHPAGGPWTSFFVAVLFLLLFPLSPLGAELLFTEKIALSSLMLVTAMYSVSLSMSSKHVGRWAMGITIGFIFSTLFGWCMGIGDAVIGPAYALRPGPVAGDGWLWTAGAGIVMVFVMHIRERFVRHVSNEEPFPEFLQR